MGKIIVIVFKNGDFTTWQQEKWDDYSYDGGVFVIKKDGEYVGIYNFDSIISVVVQDK